MRVLIGLVLLALVSTAALVLLEAGQTAPTRTLFENARLIAGNGDSIFKRLCGAMGRHDLGGDPSLAHNDGRAARQA